MLAVIEKHILVADADALAVGNRFDAERLCIAVALHLQHVEADDHALAMAVGIDGREIAQDAMPDLAVLGIDSDRLAHVKRGIGIYRHVAEEADDLLLGKDR